MKAPPSNREGPDLAREIEAASVYALITAYSEQHPTEVAEMLEAVPADEAYRVLQGLPASRAAAVFREIDTEIAARLLSRMEGDLTQTVVQQVEAGHMAALMARLDQDTRRRVWKQLNPAETEQLKTILEAEPDTAGALLDSSVSTVETDTTADQALAKVRKAGDGASEFLYVVDANRILKGVVSLGRLARSAGNARMADISSPSQTVVGPAVSRGELLSLLDQLGVTEIPVVGAQGQFLGVVLAARLRDRDEEQARSSMRRTLNRKLEERADTRLSRSIRIRAPWLAAHLLVAAAASLLVGVLSAPTPSAPIVSILVTLPAVVLVALRAGIQALNVSLRGLTLGAIASDDSMQRLTKELGVGLTLGIVTGLFLGSAAYLWEPTRAAALPLALSLILSVPISTSVGGVAPLVLLRFGKQPLKPAAVAVAAFAAITSGGSLLLAARWFASNP